MAVCRIKNRFDLGVQSEAGYRNVAVNLRLDTSETQSLAVETHVCEVQLLLLRIAAIKVVFEPLQSPSAEKHLAVPVVVS